MTPEHIHKYRRFAQLVAMVVIGIITLAAFGALAYRNIVQGGVEYEIK